MNLREGMKRGEGEGVGDGEDETEGERTRHDVMIYESLSVRRQDCTVRGTAGLRRCSWLRVWRIVILCSAGVNSRRYGCTCV